MRSYLSAAIFIAVTTSAAFSQAIPCSLLQLDPSLVTEEIVPYRHGEVSDVWTFEAPADPIIGIQIAPPSDTNAPAYICGIDFSATLAGGLAQLFFYENGYYYVEFEHQSSAMTRAVFWIGVSWNNVPTAPGSGSGKGKRIEVQAPDVLFFDPTDPKVVAQIDHSGFDGATKKGGDGLESFAEDVCAAFDANGMMPVDVTLVAHGFPGSVLLSGIGNALDGLRPENASSWGESVSGKIGHMEILSCGSAAGPLGDQLLCDFAEGAAALFLDGRTALATIREFLAEATMQRRERKSRSQKRRKKRIPRRLSRKRRGNHLDFPLAIQNSAWAPT